jgi:3',5'-cyclic AMP phosphodiesterase CpdA
LDHHRWIFRATFCVALHIHSALAQAPTHPSSVTFLHISDTHVSQLAGAHPKLIAWRDSKGVPSSRLAAFLVETVPQQKPAFVVASGDLIDAYCFDGPEPGKEIHGQIEHFASLVEKSPVPFYPGLGNHDIECYRHVEGATAATGDQSVKTETRLAWKEKLNAFRNGTYYAIPQKVGNTSYRILVLDNGESGQWVDPAFRETQMAWVRQEIQAHPKDVFIFVVHIPLSKGGFTAALQNAAAPSNRAALILAGHNHRDQLDEVVFGERSVPQVRTAALESGLSHWRAFRLFEDRIEVAETGNPANTLLTIQIPSNRSLPQ